MNQPEDQSRLEQHHEVKALEAEVLAHIADGDSDEEAAARLGISPRAVKERVTDFCEREQFDRGHSGRRLPAWCNHHLKCCISIAKSSRDARKRN